MWLDFHTKLMAAFLQLGEQIQLPPAGIMQLVKLGKASRRFLNPTEVPGKSPPIPKGWELLSVPNSSVWITQWGSLVQFRVRSVLKFPLFHNFPVYTLGQTLFPLPWHPFKCRIVPLQSPGLTEKEKSWEFLFLMDIFPALFLTQSHSLDPSKLWPCQMEMSPQQILLETRDEQSCPNSN